MLGYCLNVHPGETLDEVLAAIEGPVARARALLGDELGVGLYLAYDAAVTVATHKPALERLAAAIEKAGVRVFTANAFPFGGFHAPSVKRNVYQPQWDQAARVEYTGLVARVLGKLLPQGAAGSLSTLPLAFRGAKLDHDVAARFLAWAAIELEKIAWEDERDLALAIEPEPFCELERASELVRFLEERVFSGQGREAIARALPGLDAEAIARRRIGACLDACHHAVVFEEIEDALSAYAKAGVRVVKAQLSSALVVKDVARLRAFAEPRYLHQTFWRRGREISRAEDIEPALEAARGADEVRSHFHVPLAWAGDEQTGTTRPLLERALPRIAKATSDLEIETYTWSVLPETQKAQFGGDVSAMVASEVRWVRSASPAL